MKKNNHGSLHVMPKNKLAITAPSGAVFASETFERGLEFLRKTGFDLTVGESCMIKRDGSAKDDRRRADELKGFLSDPGYDGVVSARGGYGAVHLLPYLSDFVPPVDSPPLFGYSDITALHLWFSGFSDFRSFHAPMPASDFGKYRPESETITSFLSAFSARHETIIKGRIFRRGTAAGKMIGGNLSVFCSLCGTPYFPQIEGKILFLEEVNEPLYRVDRLLTQLTSCIERTPPAAVLFGGFSGIGDEELRSCAIRHCSAFACPLLHLPNIGHTNPNLTLPLSVPARIESANLILQIG